MKKAILILSVLALCTGVWWYVRDQQTATTPSTSTGSTKTSTKPTASEPKYLIIKEWDVHFKLPEDSEGATYTHHRFEVSGSTSEYVGIYVPAANEVPGCESSPVMSINRAKPGDIIAGSGATVEDLQQAGHTAPRLKKIGEYYFFSEIGNGPCYSGASKKQQQEYSDLEQSLMKAYDSLEHIE